MRIVVTGASGFIGSHLVKLLRAQRPHDDLIAVDLMPPVTPLPAVTYQSSLPRDGDLLFHLAGAGGIALSIDQPQQDLMKNLAPTLDVLEAARHRRFGTIVLASSAAVYGAYDGAVGEDSALRPASPYGVSKMASEHYARVYATLYGVDARIGRVGNAYGEGQSRYVIYELARRAFLQGAPLTLHGTGSETRDFVHVTDISRAFLTIAEKGGRDGVYNVGSGHPVSIREVAMIVADAVGLPPSSVCSDGSVEPGKATSFVPSIDRLRALGYAPAIPLDEGISETVAWVRRTL